MNRPIRLPHQETRENYNDGPKPQSGGPKSAPGQTSLPRGLVGRL
jgi:hypothetical protein